MNAQARMCACQLRLYFFPGCESLPQVIHRNGAKWWPYTQAVLIPSVPKPSAAQVLVAYDSPSHPFIIHSLQVTIKTNLLAELKHQAPSSRPGCGDPDSLRPPPPARPVLGAELRSWLLGSGVVPVPRLSRGRRPHNEREARGVLAHMERVPPGARAGALHRIPRTPLLLSYRRERHGGASRSRVTSQAPWGILHLEPLRLEC